MRAATVAQPVAPRPASCCASPSAPRWSPFCCICHWQVGSADVLSGEVLEFAQRAAAAGARAVQANVYNGMWHGFQLYSDGCGSGPLPAAHTSLDNTADFIKAYTKAAGAAVSGSTGSKGGLPLPEWLGFPRIQHHYRWPEEGTRETLLRSLYNW